MAHAHAHPAPDALYLQSHTSSHPNDASPSPGPSIKASPPKILASQRQQQLEGQSPHARRLHLRNAGFRAPLLPGRRISPILSSTANQDSFFPACIATESTPLATERKSSFSRGGRRISPSSNILQEISNSSTRRPGPGRAPLGSIFQENIPFETRLSHDGGRSRRISKTPSTPALENMENQAVPSEVVASHNISSADNTPIKQLKVRKKSRSHLQSSSFEATKYIEHLESELASANTRIETLTSPTSTKAHSARFRGLTKQVQSLRQEVSEWELRFDERVGDQLFQRATIQAELKDKLKILEEEAETKDARVQDLEQELLAAQEKLQASEVLETNLERRVDVLTELLAQSPTRLNYSSNANCGPSEGVKKTPRPQSLVLPRLMTSPTLTSPTSRRLWSTQEVERDGLTVEGAMESQTSPIGKDFVARESRYSTFSTLSGSTRYISDYETSNQSAPSSSSRPTSMISNSSEWSSLAAPLPTESAVKIECRPRKMRRFKSGSTNLKPLLLPATASLPASAPAESDAEPVFRDSLGLALNQRCLPLSRCRDSSPSPSPSKRFRQRSVPFTEALYEDQDMEDECSFVDDAAVQEREPDVPSPITPPLSPEQQNLQKELELAGLAAAAAGHASETLEDDIQGNVETLSANRIRSPEANLDSILMNPSRSTPPCRSASDNVDTTPKASKQTRSVCYRSPMSIPLNPSIPFSADGFMACITSFVASIRRDALVSAKIILANSWGRSSSVLGGFGWWLIGLVYGPRARVEFAAASRGAADGARPRSFEMSQQLTCLLQSSCDGQITSLDQNKVEHSRSCSSNNHHPCSQSTTRADGKFGSPSSAPHPKSSSNDNNLAVQCWKHRCAHSSTQQTNTNSPLTTSIITTTTLGEPADLYAHHHKQPNHRLDNKDNKSSTSREPRACASCTTSPSPSRKFKLWYRFSLAIVLAIGVAVLEGPGVLLEPEGESKFDDGTLNEGKVGGDACYGKDHGAGVDDGHMTVCRCFDGCDQILPQPNGAEGEIQQSNVSKRNRVSTPGSDDTLTQRSGDHGLYLAFMEETSRVSSVDAFL